MKIKSRDVTNVLLGFSNDVTDSISRSLRFVYFRFHF